MIELRICMWVACSRSLHWPSECRLQFVLSALHSDCSIHFPTIVLSTVVTSVVLWVASHLLSHIDNRLILGDIRCAVLNYHSISHWRRQDVNTGIYFQVAIDESFQENGCMWFGKNKVLSVLPHRPVREGCHVLTCNGSEVTVTHCRTPNLFYNLNILTDMSIFIHFAF